METERLIIRKFTLDDTEDMDQMNLDEEVSKYTGDGGIQPIEVIRERIEKNIMGDYEKHGFGRYAVVRKSNNELLGFTGLKYLPELDEVDIGYRLIRSSWGKGFATEASKPFIQYGFNTLGLNKIIGLVMPENLASIRVLEKLGLTYEKMITIYDEDCMYFTIHSE